MYRGPGRTTSGWPIGSDADMAYHRATGEQVPKSEEARLEYATYGRPGMGHSIGAIGDVPVLDLETYHNGRAVITVASMADLDRLAELDLPEGVEVVVAHDGLFPPDVAGVYLDTRPKRVMIDSAMGRMAAAFAAMAPGYGRFYDSVVEAGKGMAEYTSTLMPDAPLTPWYDESSSINRREWALYGGRSGCQQKSTKDYDKRRRAAKAARKARRNNRRKK